MRRDCVKCGTPFHALAGGAICDHCMAAISDAVSLSADISVAWLRLERAV